MGTYIVIGVVSGVIYGLAALGIVLVYKGSRVFNFAQGEFGTLAMYSLFFFRESIGLNYLVAAILAVAVSVCVGLATERAVVRRLETAPKVVALVGTVGVALLAIGLELAIGGTEQLRQVSPALSGDGMIIFDFVVLPQQILSMVVLTLIAAGAALFFQRTFLGMGILANSQDSTAARLVGANARRISSLTWGIAGLVGGVAGVLLAPQVNIIPGYMTTDILIPAFTAAIVGGMTSLPGAFAGGLIVGLVEAMGDFARFKYEALRVVPEGTLVLVFLVLVLTLLLRPRGLFGTEA